MVNGIQELNFPEYATLSAATVTLPDMGEWTITSQVKIDGQIAPDFSFDWAVVHNGHKYIQPLRKPQGEKANDSLSSVIDLTFQHWAIYQLKRWYFFTIQPTAAGVAWPDKYIASVSLHLGDFCNLLGQILDYYFHGKITVELNPDWVYKAEPETMEISYSRIWDVISKLYEVYGVRWRIEPKNGVDKYVIRIGYPTTEQSHIFEYGFEGGLLKVERQVQSDEICNMLLGRGGEKNLPARYFKKASQSNPTFEADPDWVEELANVYFANLMPATFRSYIQGWKAAHIQQYPGYEIIGEANAYAPWAYRKGFTDQTFDPVEYVADEITIEPEQGDVKVEISPSYKPYVKKDSSIAKYGPLMNGLENNEEIYPTIQGVTVAPYGRIDEAVAVEPILSDNVEEATESESVLKTVQTNAMSMTIPAESRREVNITSAVFEIPEGMTGNIELGALVIGNEGVVLEGTPIVTAYRSGMPNEGQPAVGLSAGKWWFTAKATLYNSTNKAIAASFNFERAQLVYSNLADKWHGTWDIWVKNIWGTAKKATETEAEYAERVWRPILGDRMGNEAKVVFATGALAHEDYEFTIVAIPKFEQKQCKWTTTENGQTVEHEYVSEWRITLGKSDADKESLKNYIPYTMRQAVAGDFFFFIGIDMPHLYARWAEERLDAWRTDQLKEKSDIKPTWVVQTDRVRLNGEGSEDALIRQLQPGDILRLADKRFIEGAYETLYLSSMTLTYREPSSDDTALNPDVEIVLSDRWESPTSSVSLLSGEVNALTKQVGSLSNLEAAIRVFCDKLYLRKDGLSDVSVSPTAFAGLVTSQGFRQGMIGGKGWGFYRDEQGRTYLETDCLNVRQDMAVNNLVVNQISARGGMIIESAASIEVTNVVQTAQGWELFFDQKGGSIVNLFKVDDVAMSLRFDAEKLNQNPSAALKFYKRYVVAVNANSIVVSDNGMVGGGIPEIGDVVVQYGNKTDSSRQYVIVRNVAGGGYERFIEGLDSTTAEGEEYFFVGRQTGMYNGRPRFFIGDALSYLEYVDGKLRFKGVLESDSLIGDTPFSEWVDTSVLKSISKLTGGGVNLLRDSDFRNPAAGKWSITKIGSAKWAYVDMEGSESRGLKVTTTKLTDQIIIRQSLAGLDLSNKGALTLSLLAEGTAVGSLTINAQLGLKVKTDGVEQTQYVNFGRIEPPFPIAGKRIALSVYLDDEVEGEITAVESLTLGGSGIGEVTLSELMLETGNNNLGWVNSPLDNEFLRDALRESSTMAGGLILGSLLLLGQTDSLGNYNVTAGINGVVSSEKKGGGVAIFAGGSHADAATETNGAAMAFRHDGTGYASNNIIRFEKDHVAIGDNDVLKLFADGLYMMSNGIPKLRILNSAIQGDVMSVSNNVTIPIPLRELYVEVNSQNNNYLACSQLPMSFPINGGYLPYSGYVDMGTITMTIEDDATWADNSKDKPSLVVGTRLIGGNSYTDRAVAPFSIIGGNKVAQVVLGSTKRLYIPAAGNWELFIAIENPDGSYPSYLTGRKATLQGVGVRMSYAGASGLTTIGTNGQCMEFGNAAFKFYEGYFGARIGNMVFEMSNANGIRVSKTGGGTDGWKSLI